MDFLVGSIGSAIFGGAQQAIQAVASVGEVKNVGTSSNSGSDAVHLSLAPCYGSLNNVTMQKIDDNTKVMIGTTISMLQSMSGQDRTWDNVVSAMKSNSLLEFVDGSATHHSDQILNIGSHDFKFDGSPDQGVVNEIVSWFTNLIADADILKTMTVNIGDLARIAAQTGATIRSVGSVIFSDETQFKNVLDIGALRYPDLDNPHFKVYRIQVNAWSHSKRILFHQEDSNGVGGDFDCCHFRPRADRIASMTDEVRKEAIRMAEALFNS